MATMTPQELKSTLGVEYTFDILNAIRNEATAQYQNIVPIATNSNIGEVGQGVTKLDVIQNEFISALVDRISLVVLKRKSLKNPLAKFKKGSLPLGRTIEEIFVDILQAKKYDAQDSEQTVFKREKPDTKVYFHHRNRQDFYKQTIQEDSLKAAFTSWGTFDNFLSLIINAVYNSAEVDEYLYMMKLVNEYHKDGKFKKFDIEQTGDETKDAKELLKMMRILATRMTLPMGSREFNASGVHTRTETSDLHVFMKPETEAEVDVNVLASAFNMDKAQFIGNRTLVDGFEDPSVLAVLIDKNWFMVYDTLQKMTTIYNPQGLYWNYNYHVWQVMSCSLLENAVVITKAPSVPTARVIPADEKVKQGATLQFTDEVGGLGSLTVTGSAWTVSAKTGSLKAGTTISTNGLLTVDPAETLGDIIITCEVTLSDASKVSASATATVISK